MSFSSSNEGIDRRQEGLRPSALTFSYGRDLTYEPHSGGVSRSDPVPRTHPELRGHSSPVV